MDESTISHLIFFYSKIANLYYVFTATCKVKCKV